MYFVVAEKRACLRKNVSSHATVNVSFVIENRMSPFLVTFVIITFPCNSLEFENFESFQNCAMFHIIICFMA